MFQILKSFASGIALWLAMLTAIAALRCDDAEAQSPGLIVSRTSGLITDEAGRSDTITIRLATQPTADVRVTLVIGSLPEVAASPTYHYFGRFTDWNIPFLFTITGLDDHEGPLFQDGDQPFTIRTHLTSADPNYNNLFGPNIQGTNLDLDPGPPSAVTRIAPTHVQPGEFFDVDLEIANPAIASIDSFRVVMRSTFFTMLGGEPACYAQGTCSNSTGATVTHSFSGDSMIVVGSFATDTWGYGSAYRIHCQAGSQRRTGRANVVIARFWRNGAEYSAGPKGSQPVSVGNPIRVRFAGADPDYVLPIPQEPPPQLGNPGLYTARLMAIGDSTTTQANGYDIRLRTNSYALPWFSWQPGQGMYDEDVCDQEPNDIAFVWRSTTTHPDGVTMSCVTVCYAASIQDAGEIAVVQFAPFGAGTTVPIEMVSAIFYDAGNVVRAVEMDTVTVVIDDLGEIESVVGVGPLPAAPGDGKTYDVQGRRIDPAAKRSGVVFGKKKRVTVR